MIRRHQVMGRDGMTMAVITALVLAVIAFFVGNPAPFPGDMGLCFPSPNEWPLNGIAEWGLNTAFILISAILLWFCNKEFSFVQGNDTVLMGMFLVMAASNTWLIESLSAAGIMAFANLICILILFGCYRKRNATQEMFLIATILALGSMIQYCFIFMLPVYIIGAIILKCFNFKCLVAMILGIIAPYWIGVGFGLIPVDSFRMPEFTNIFESNLSSGSLFIMLVNVALTVVIGFFLALNNMVRLYAGNTQRYLYNTVFNVLGIISVICLILDFNNFFIYIDTIYVVCAVQLANLFALWDINRGSLWLMGISAIYIIGFFLML